MLSSLPGGYVRFPGEPTSSSRFPLAKTPRTPRNFWGVEAILQTGESQHQRPVPRHGRVGAAAAHNAAAANTRRDTAAALPRRELLLLIGAARQCPMLRDGPGEVAHTIPPPLPDGPNRSPTGLGRAGPADIRDYLWIAPPNLGARQEEQSAGALTPVRTAPPFLTVGLLRAMTDERGVWGADRIHVEAAFLACRTLVPRFSSSTKRAPSETLRSRTRSPPMKRARRRLKASPKPTPGAERAAS